MSPTSSFMSIVLTVALWSYVKVLFDLIRFFFKREKARGLFLRCGGGGGYFAYLHFSFSFLMQKYVYPKKVCFSTKLFNFGLWKNLDLCFCYTVYWKMFYRILLASSKMLLPDFYPVLTRKAIYNVMFVQGLTKWPSFASLAFLQFSTL